MYVVSHIKSCLDSIKAVHTKHKSDEFTAMCGTFLYTRPEVLSIDYICSYRQCAKSVASLGVFSSTALLVLCLSIAIFPHDFDMPNKRMISVYQVDFLQSA